MKKLLIFLMFITSGTLMMAAYGNGCIEDKEQGTATCTAQVLNSTKMPFERGVERSLTGFPEKVIPHDYSSKSNYKITLKKDVWYTVDYKAQESANEFIPPTCLYRIRYTGYSLQIISTPVNKKAGSNNTVFCSSSLAGDILITSYNS